jgi:hypothetical protein
MRKFTLATLVLIVSFLVSNNSKAQTAITPIGTGSQCDPYQINNLGNLYWISQTSSSWVAGKFFIQTADIDASATATYFPNGNGGYYGFPTIAGGISLVHSTQQVGNLVNGSFSANYNGQGFEIINLYINRNVHRVALFGATTNATIKNLIIQSPTIIVSNSVSSYAQGNSLFVASGSGVFENIKVINGNLTVNTSIGYAGGMFGRFSTISANNCSVDAIITVTSSTGGSGGFISLIEGNGNISNCSASGSLSSINCIYVGGFISRATSTTTIEKCFSKMNVTSSGYTGGFISDCKGETISNCYASGNISGSNRVGGFVGYSDGTTYTSTMNNCYSTGLITGSTSGGFAGQINTNLTLNNCFWDTQTSGKINFKGTGTNTSTGIIGKTSAEMKTLSTFTNATWDFNSIWNLTVGVNNDYPNLIVPTISITYLSSTCPSWLGTNSTNWANASNWSNNTVPSIGANIIINENAVNDLVLDQNRTISLLSFNGAGKKVVLGDFNLTATTITGGNGSNFIQSNGTGKLLVSIPTNSSSLFPIGNSSYNAVTIKNNSGASDVFAARVVDAVYLNGSNSYTFNFAPIVNRTWDISKTNSNSGSGIDFVFNWNNSDVINGPMNSYVVNHFNGSTWEIPTVTSSSYSSNSLAVVGYTGSFSPFAISETTSALPVELTSFNANCTENATIINWQTASEHNTAYFEVERSRDGANWSSIESIQAAGNSTTTIDYSIEDAEKTTGVVYYRLNQVDLNGESKIYGPISANCNDEDAFTSLVYPNPTKDVFTLELSNNTPQNVTIQLVGTDGKEVCQLTRLVEVGTTMLPLSIEGLKSGVYSLQIQSSTSLRALKLVVL